MSGREEDDEPLVAFAFTTTMPGTTFSLGPTDEEDLRDAAHLLITQARKRGLVITIECRPLQPLAMGNHEQVVEFRPVRVAS